MSAFISESLERRDVLVAGLRLAAAAVATLLGAGAAVSVGAAPAQALRKWECQNDECEPFIYDPAKGIPDYDIPPGVPFEELPEDFVCPVCGDVKRQFLPLEDSY